jgi:hypothetical protein
MPKFIAIIMIIEVILFKSDMVVHGCNPSYSEVETGGCWVWGQQTEELGGVTQGIEPLPSMCYALDSIPSTTKEIYLTKTITLCTMLHCNYLISKNFRALVFWTLLLWRYALLLRLCKYSLGCLFWPLCILYSHLVVATGVDSVSHHFTNS